MTAGYCILGKQILCVFLSISHFLNLSLLAIIMIIAEIDRSNLYCNSVAITKETFNNSTIFCEIAGWTTNFCIYN